MRALRALAADELEGDPAGDRMVPGGAVVPRWGAVTTLLVLVDGIGFGRSGAPNPFDGAPVSVLAPLAGREGPRGLEVARVDATLGHPGLPQSATGHACLYTGKDCVAVAGGHRTGFPVGALARFVVEQSIFAEARAGGLRAGFLNAFPAERARHIERVVRGEEPRPKHFYASASTLAAVARGGALLTLDDAFAGRAATYDITGELAHAHGVVAPRRTAAAAARAVMAGAREHDLALFELFLTDKAGHAQDTTWARHEIGRTEAFLAALLAECDVERDLVVVTSDHGNLEDLSTRSHTRADVPILAWGRGAGALVASLGPRPDLAVVGAAVLANARAKAAPARAPAP